MWSSFFGEFGRIALLDALDVHTEDLLEAGPNHRLEIIPVLIQRRNAPFVAHQLIAETKLDAQKECDRVVTILDVCFQIFL